MCYIPGMTRKKCQITRSSLLTARVRAVRARKAGMRTKDIAAALGVNPITVSRWLGQYRLGGARMLRNKKSLTVYPLVAEKNH